MKVDKLERLNPMAIEVTKVFSDTDKYEIESRYMSAASSFAIDEKRLKLAQTVISYHNQGKEGNKYALIPKGILSIVKNENLMEMSSDSIYTYYFENRGSRKFRREVRDAATALKYEMRMYKSIDNTSSEDGHDE